jgi:hypothetical protein
VQENPTDGTCAPSVVAAKPSVSLAAGIQYCTYATVPDAGCAPGQVPTPELPDGSPYTGYCIAADVPNGPLDCTGTGDYKFKSTFTKTWQDSRGCADAGCGCSQVTGATCAGGMLRVGTNSCLSNTVDVPTDGTCNADPGTGGQYTPGTFDPGSCNPTGQSAPTGDVSPTSSVTLCCLSPVP